MTTPRHPTKAQRDVITLLESSPGGITIADVRMVIAKYTLVHIGSFMISLSAWSVFWEEIDPDDGEIWYHSIKFDHLYPDHHFKPQPHPVKTVKLPMKIRGNLENPVNYAWIKIDRETCNQVKAVATESGQTMLIWFADAVAQKLECKNKIELPEPTWKYTTLAGVRMPRDLIRQVKKAVIGTELTIVEFCREAAREKMEAGK